MNKVSLRNNIIQLKADGEYIKAAIARGLYISAGGKKQITLPLYCSQISAMTANLLKHKRKSNDNLEILHSICKNSSRVEYIELQKCEVNAVNIRVNLIECKVPHIQLKMIGKMTDSDLAFIISDIIAYTDKTKDYSNEEFMCLYKSFMRILSVGRLSIC